MSAHMIPSAFLKNVQQNGVGRYVCQLQRLTFRFCKSHGGSRGVRDFIENHLLDFTRENPGVVIYLKPRRHRPADVMAEYLNGQVHKINLNCHVQEDICGWVSYLHTRSGVAPARLRKAWHTDNPSIQGVWHPFLNKDTGLNITPFPDPELSACQPAEMSATDKLLELAKQLHLNEKSASKSRDSVESSQQTSSSSLKE